jgi:hypothetical protein
VPNVRRTPNSSRFEFESRSHQTQANVEKGPVTVERVQRDTCCIAVISPCPGPQCSTDEALSLEGTGPIVQL